MAPMRKLISSQLCALTGLACVAFALGCQADPDIEVRSLDLVATGPTADEYALRIALRNTSEKPLVLDLWQYDISTAQGSWSSQWVASRTLPARTAIEQSLPVVLRHDGQSKSIESWQVHGTLRYLLPGQLAETLFDLGVSRPNVDFSGSGSSTSIAPAAPAVESR